MIVISSSANQLWIFTSADFSTRGLLRSYSHCDGDRQVRLEGECNETLLQITSKKAYFGKFVQKIFVMDTLTVLKTRIRNAFCQSKIAKIWQDVHTYNRPRFIWLIRGISKIFSNYYGAPINYFFKKYTRCPSIYYCNI